MKQYSKVRVKKPRIAAHNLSHEAKTSLNMGELVPVLLHETLPGDMFNINTQMLLRMQPMLAPLMHRVNCFIHYFHVPYRLIWDNSENFFTGGESGNAAPNFPKFTGNYTDFEIAPFAINGLADQLGIPVKQYIDGAGNIPNEAAPSISQLPFRAYQLIYNEYYRNQNFELPVVIKTNDADYNIGHADVQSMLKLRKRCWEKDYFTSLLPTPQRGTPVSMEVSGTAPVQGTIKLELQGSSGTPLSLKDVGTTGTGQLSETGGGNASVLKRGTNDVFTDASSDLANLTIDVNDFRLALALQRFKEKAMRGGSRYIEVIKSFFGVHSSDARQQRPEFLGGGRLPINISEVLQLNQSDVTPQGNMAGHGVVGGVPCSFSRTFEEHGFVIGILSVMPRTGYAQGLPRIFSKFDKFDYFWPELAHIGEQEILKQELFVSDNDSANNTQLLGYGERYCEYRSVPDAVRGDLRDTLKFWTLHRDFSGEVELNDTFVIANPDKRIWPVVDGDNAGTYRKMIAYLYFDFKAIRPVPKYGTPM